MFLKRLINIIIKKLGILIYNMDAEIAKATLPKFANNPKNLRIDTPRRIINPEYMFLGDNISLGPGSFLMAVTQYPGPTMKHPDKEQSIQKFKPKIIIGDRVTSTAGLQLAAVSEITIDNDVMFASNIFIVDGQHGYENANESYKYQKIFKIAPTRIKQGCWIGQNAVILSGVTIGEFSIIGANSFVANSIPDRCMAVGSPAKVIKTWDDASQKWVSKDDE